MAQVADSFPFQRKMEFQFRGQFAVELGATPAKEKAAPSPEQRRLNVQAHAMLRTFSIARTTRANSVRSVASCFRPPAVKV